jgi:acetyl-CoA carboxylase, biotin carboxylase subunit
MVTGVDLVREQILVAAGETLGFRQSDIKFNGHAIECRINAESPVSFVPSPGLITALNFPGGPGVRIDTAAYAGWFVPPQYDSLVAKIIAHDSTRDAAIARMRRILDAVIIEGIETSVPMHQRILADPDFIAGNISTRFMERFMPKAKGKASE